MKLVGIALFAVLSVSIATVQLRAAVPGECGLEASAPQAASASDVERLTVSPSSEASESWDMTFDSGRGHKTANLSFEAPEGKSFDPDVPITARISGDLLDRETKERLPGDRQHSSFEIEFDEAGGGAASFRAKACFDVDENAEAGTYVGSLTLRSAQIVPKSIPVTATLRTDNLASPISAVLLGVFFGFITKILSGLKSDPTAKFSASDAWGYIQQISFIIGAIAGLGAVALVVLKIYDSSFGGAGDWLALTFGCIGALIAPISISDAFKTPINPTTSVPPPPAPPPPAPPPRDA